MDLDFPNFHHDVDNQGDMMAMMHNLFQSLKEEIKQELHEEQSIRPNPRSMKEYYNPVRYQLRQGIRYLDLEAKFELKPTS